MRKSYVKPALISEEFIPQIYCGACKNAEGTTTYSASCDTSGYVFWDTNNNGVLDDNDEYCNYNTAGSSCKFTIDYHPGNKNAFCISVSKGTNIWKNEWYETVKDTYKSQAIYGYRIEEKDRWGNVEDSHFIANLNSETFKPNMS